MKKLVVAALVLIAVWVPRAAAATTRLDFVREYVRTLAEDESTRELNEKEMTEAAGSDRARLMTAVRVGARVSLALGPHASMLKKITLSPPFEKTANMVAEAYEYKIKSYQRMSEISQEFISGPKSGVDYGALAAELPKHTAMLENIDKSLFEVTPAVFLMLADTGREDSQGHVSRLLITCAERDELLRSLQLQFGTKLDQSEPNYIVASAISLRDGLAKKGWKCSDETALTPQPQPKYTQPQDQPPPGRVKTVPYLPLSQTGATSATGQDQPSPWPQTQPQPQTQPFVPEESLSDPPPLNQPYPPPQEAYHSPPHQPACVKWDVYWPVPGMVLIQTRPLSVARRCLAASGMTAIL